jgi:hypothetical protein
MNKCILCKKREIEYELNKLFGICSVCKKNLEKFKNKVIEIEMDGNKYYIFYSHRLERIICKKNCSKKQIYFLLAPHLDNKKYWLIKNGKAYFFIQTNF